MRKIILNLAISLDGYIAGKDGGFDWIVGDGDKHLNTPNLFDFPEFVNSIDTIVMGRLAFEDCGVEAYADKKVVVATSQALENYENVVFVKSNINDYIQKLQQEDGKDIWLFGGGMLTDSFIKADIVDEYIVGIIPIILGTGKKLFLGDNPMIKLHLDNYTVDEGIPIMRYSRRKEA